MCPAAGPGVIPENRKSGRFIPGKTWREAATRIRSICGGAHNNVSFLRDDHPTLSFLPVLFGDTMPFAGRIAPSRNHQHSGWHLGKQPAIVVICSPLGRTRKFGWIKIGMGALAFVKNIRADDLEASGATEKKEINPEANEMNLIIRLAASVLPMLLLISCGGGGGSGNIPAASTPVISTTITPVTPGISRDDYDFAAERQYPVRGVVSNFGASGSFRSSFTFQNGLLVLDDSIAITPLPVDERLDIASLLQGERQIHNAKISRELTDRGSIAGSGDELMFRSFTGWADGTDLNQIFLTGIGGTISGNVVSTSLGNVITEPLPRSGTATYEGVMLGILSFFRDKGDDFAYWSHESRVHGKVDITADFTRSRFTQFEFSEINSEGLPLRRNGDYYSFNFTGVRFGENGEFARTDSDGSFVSGRFYGDGGEIGGVFENRIRTDEVISGSFGAKE